MTKSSPVSFSVIIPNYNGASFLPQCLDSLYKALTPIKLSYEVILVDNGSTDGSLALAQSLLGRYFKNRYQLISLPKNRGFAGGVNAGIMAAHHSYVVLLNNDLTLRPDWFKLISSEIQNTKDPRVVTFFGTVLNKDGTKIESQGLKFFSRGKAQNISNGRKLAPHKLTKQTPRLVWGASAALVVYHTQTLKNVGLFDEDFFAYEEDVDLALRLHNLGYKTLYVPQALSCHLGGGTSSKMGNFRSRHDAKNWIYLIAKNYSYEEFIACLPELIEERLRNFSGLCKNTIRSYGWRSLWLLPAGVFSTYFETFLTLPQMIRKRKLIQSLVKSSQ